MSEYTIRPITVRGGTVIVQLDPSQSVAVAVAAADAAAASEAAAQLDATATAADRVQTGIDASATAADRVQTGLDRTAAEDAAADAAATLAASLRIDQNLSDVASVATARTNLDVPPNARTISAGTGLTGGGSLAANRTLSASIASQAEAETGTASTVLMTPQRTRQAVNATGTAPIYAPRAWVNFNGTGTVAIRASGNVSSITDNGVGDYTINFTTAMPDANFSAVCNAGSAGGGALTLPTAYTTSSVRIRLFDLAGAARDDTFVNVVVFR